MGDKMVILYLIGTATEETVLRAQVAMTRVAIPTIVNVSDMAEK
jgi:hypothetical protein